MIHGDINNDNVPVDEHGRIVGLIDVEPFHGDELESVMDLALARLATSYGAHNLTINPDNRHYDLNAATASAVLEHFEGTDPQERVPAL